jgi:hypothetical protein
MYIDIVGDYPSALSSFGKHTLIGLNVLMIFNLTNPSKAFRRMTGFMLTTATFLLIPDKLIPG